MKRTLIFHIGIRVNGHSSKKGKDRYYLVNKQMRIPSQRLFIYTKILNYQFFSQPEQ